MEKGIFGEQSEEDFVSPSPLPNPLVTFYLGDCSLCGLPAAGLKLQLKDGNSANHCMLGGGEECLCALSLDTPQNCNSHTIRTSKQNVSMLPVDTVSVSVLSGDTYQVA